MERAEEEIAGSNLLVQDPKLTGYLKDLIGKVGGPAAKDFRIYLARDPRVQRDDVPERLRGGVHRAAAAHAQRGAAGRRDRARIRATSCAAT